MFPGGMLDMLMQRRRGMWSTIILFALWSVLDTQIWQPAFPFLASGSSVVASLTLFFLILSAIAGGVWIGYERLLLAVPLGAFIGSAAAAALAGWFLNWSFLWPVGHTALYVCAALGLLSGCATLAVVAVDMWRRARPDAS